MRIREPSPQCLETDHVPGALPLVLAAAAVCAVALTVVYARHWPLFIVFASSVVSALGAFGAWAQALRTRFRFDAVERRIHWLRTAPARRSSGGLGFDEVRQVVIQSGPGRRGRSARICLLTDHGLEPLARDFSLERGDAARVASRIRALLGLEDACSVEARVLDLLRAGNEHGARSVLEHQQGLNSDQARALVDELKRR